MSKIKCFNCGEMGHFARNCPKPRENANLAQENERNSNFANLMDLGDSSVCEECAMICTDVYSTDESEDMVVYGDQGISSEKYDEDTYGDLMNTDSDDEQVVKYNVALLAKDSVSLEKKRRRLNRDIPSETTNQLSRFNEESDTKQGLTSQDEEIESQEAWTMGMPSIDGDISTTNSSEQLKIEDKNKKFLYARAIHASHMIQHHMYEISERELVIDEYRSMMDDDRELIPLDSDLHKSDLVIIQHIMQMIDTDIFWYGETFKEVLTELRKIAHSATTMHTGEKLDQDEHFESAMMCWESLDESEPTSKKRKTLPQGEATNDQSDEIDDDQRTANKGIGSHMELIPLDSDLHKSDLVIIQHIMQMIDTDIFWYRETFKEVLTELRKIAHSATTMHTGEKLDQDEHFESAMMCWQSLDESEPTSKKRKTLPQGEATNDQSDEIDDDQRTANKGIGSHIPVNDLQLGADNDASTLATQET